MSVVTCLLVVPALYALFGLCDLLQRARARWHDGWRYLTPGPMTWLGLGCGLVLTGVFTLVALSDQSTPFLIGVAGAFNGIAPATTFVTLREEVRWTDTPIERRTISGEIRRMARSELAADGDEISGYHWISGYERPRIRFHSSSHGSAEPMAMIDRRRPGQGPPTVPAQSSGTLVATRRA